MTFKELRKSKNLSINELCLMLSVSNSKVSSWDNGERPEPIILKDLASILGVSEEVLSACFKRS